MKKNLSILSLGLILAGSNFGYSQENQIYRCHTDEVMEAHFAADPAARARYENSQKEFQNIFLEKNENMSGNKTAATVYTVPVVFHILHQGGPENVSDATCIAALAAVNRDYARQGSDTNLIFTPFKSKYIDSEIRFVLAKKDPNGNCINGIVRHWDAKTQWDQGAAQSSGAYWPYTWTASRYLNIYIVANIISSSPISGGQVGGYTYRPGSWPTNDNHDAIIYRYTLLGTQFSNGSRALSHEIGHWLNLGHTFGNTNNPGTNCGDDGIPDTPVTKGNYNACPVASANTGITCQSGQTPYYQNVENFMDYSNCPRNFTQNQTSAMRNTLVIATNGRNNLVSATNLGPGFTDVDGTTLCTPIAEFLSTTGLYTVCSGGTLTMKDISSNAVITNYQWTTDNSTAISAPTSSFTQITFNTVGITTVSLTVSNASGSSTKVRTVLVINGTPAIIGPYTESFENTNPSLPPNWSVYTLPTSGPDWQHAPGAALDGSSSYYVEGLITPGGQTTYLQMPTIDLLNNQGSTLRFAYTYARKSTAHNDVFRLQASKDCGGSWVDVFSKSSVIMTSESSEMVSTTPYFPMADSLWKIVDVVGSTFPQWNQFTGSPSVWIRFAFEEAAAGAGNNFYLDAINFMVPTGVNALTSSIGLSLYPNPSTGETNLKFRLHDPAAIELGIVDLLGKEVLPASSMKYNAGEQTIVINKDNTLAKGVYFVNVTMNGTKMSRKLIIN